MYTAAVYLFEWHLQNHVAICNIPQLINQVKRHVDSCHADSGAERFSPLRKISWLNIYTALVHDQVEVL